MVVALSKTLCFATPLSLYYFYYISENLQKKKFVFKHLPLSIKTNNFIDFANTREILLK